MPKNIIVQMADRLRAGRAGDAAGAEGGGPQASFESRRQLLVRLAENIRECARADARFAHARVKVLPSADEPDRLIVRHGTRIVTFRIAPELEYFVVAGSGVGRRFSANPAHLQSDDAVLLSADVGAATPVGSEYHARDFLEDLATDKTC